MRETQKEREKERERERESMNWDSSCSVTRGGCLLIKAQQRPEDTMTKDRLTAAMQRHSALAISPGCSSS